MKSIVVFCGSSPGRETLFHREAAHLGGLLAQRGIRLVYGGAQVGLMGAVANGALEAGGKVTGVLPRFLQTKEIAHAGLTELLLTDTMHERKLKMHELSDAVIALPGGFGTLEELFEMLTWAQLGLHRKPIGILNTGGYYDALQELVAVMEDKGFLKPEHAALLLFSDKAEELLRLLENYEPPVSPKWIDEERT